MQVGVVIHRGGNDARWFGEITTDNNRERKRRKNKCDRDRSRAGRKKEVKTNGRKIKKQ